MKRGTSIESRTSITRDGVTIFKRYEGADQPYYYIARPNGQRRKHKLVVDSKESIRLAKRIREAVLKGRYSVLEDEKERRASSWTIGELEPLFNSAPIRAKNRARRDTWCTMMNILRQLEPNTEDPRRHPISILADITHRWKIHTDNKANKSANQRAEAVARRTANSMLAHIRSLVSPVVVDHYERVAGITSPAFDLCYKGCRLHRHAGVPAKTVDVPPHETIRKTLDAWEKIGDRNVFLAVGLELSFGLRAGEVGQARWNWLTTQGDVPYLDTYADPEAHVKNRSGRIEVPGVDPFYDKFITRARHEGWIERGAEYILEGNLTERTDKVFRRVSAFLRDLGWKTQKTNHAIRDYIGSQLIMRYGPHSAQSWCRHSSVETTEQHYSSFVTKAGTLNKDLIEARWAKVTPLFQPSVVRETAA